MTTIYLIRHAQAEGNIYCRCQGWYNSLITPTGYRQIEALAERFRHTHFDAVYSSDLFRTMTTAGAIYRTHNLPLHTDPLLREIGTGCWEDHTWGDLFHDHRESLLSFWHCDPGWQVEGSETFPGIQQRFCTRVEQIAADHPGQTIAIVAHGTVIRSGLAHWMGLPPEHINRVPHGDNTCVARLEYENGAMKVDMYNDVSHLSRELAATPPPKEVSVEATASALERSSLYFRPLTPSEAGAAYLDAQADSWQFSYGCMDRFDPEGVQPEGTLMTAMQGDRAVGLLSLAPDSCGGGRAGQVALLYLAPELRFHGLGVQLIGQAVSHFRKLGKQYLRLTCAPENESGQCFYRKHGFSKVGEVPGGLTHLDLLEKYIGYNSQ